MQGHARYPTDDSVGRWMCRQGGPLGVVLYITEADMLYLYWAVLCSVAFRLTEMFIAVPV